MPHLRGETGAADRALGPGGSGKAYGFVVDAIAAEDVAAHWGPGRPPNGWEWSGQGWFDVLVALNCGRTQADPIRRGVTNCQVAAAACCRPAAVHCLVGARRRSASIGADRSGRQWGRSEDHSEVAVAGPNRHYRPHVVTMRQFGHF